MTADTNSPTPVESQDAQRLKARSAIIGVWSLAALIALLGVSLDWLRADERFGASASLSIAARLIMERSAIAAHPEEVLQAAAQGMMSALDPYSAYLSPRELELFQEESEGEYVGIGVEVRIVGGALTVSDVYPQSPAADAFVRPGDRITAVDGTATTGMEFEEVLELMHGDAGSAVRLEIETSGPKRRELTLIRRPITIEPFPIVGATRSGVAYVRWAQFSIGSADRLAAIIEDLMIEEPIGLILDLRGNPGGILDEAIAAAGLFLPTRSEVCTLVDPRGDPIHEFTTSAIPPVFHGPLVIVQDEMSASSAEVLAAALRDAGRAAIVGRRSFGKGWVQNIFPLDNAGALRLSTARYATPSGSLLGDPVQARALYDSVLAGRPWEGSGLMPDTAVAATTEGAWERALFQSGTLPEFVAEYTDEWPATGAADAKQLLKELRKWLNARDLIHPPSAADSLLTNLGSTEREHRLARQHAKCTKLLQSAIDREIDLVLSREQPRLLRYLWEKRLLQLDRPDPGELEALLELDPDLSAARDLLEQPERYRSLIE